MIAHNKNLLENQFLVNEAESLEKAGFISPENLEAIKKELPLLKTQKNIFLRIAMGLLGILLYAAICGFLALIGINNIGDTLRFFLFIYAIIGFAGVEYYAQQDSKEMGLDDVFLIGGQLFLLTAISYDIPDNNLEVAITATIVSFLSYLRYTHLSSVLIFCVASVATIGFGVFKSVIPSLALPFIMMFYAISIYVTTSKATQKVQFPFYHLGLTAYKNFALVLFYLSGNYMVVRELSVELLNLKITPETDIPIAWFFYFFTFAVPALYIIFALKRQERIMLWIGFLATGFSIYTIRMYHHVLPPEVALTLGGLLLFGLSYFCIKILKKKETGLTFKEDRFATSENFVHAESLIVTSQFGIKPETTIESPMEFGGGDFSGGGSGSSF